MAEKDSWSELRGFPGQVKISFAIFIPSNKTENFDLINRLEHLKRQCEPHLVETVKGSVEALCTKVFTLSVEHVKKIRERHVVSFP
jgi:hypothetical protein